MRIVRFVFFLSVVTLFSCHKTKNEYLIPEKKFKEILFELHLADGYYSVNYGKYQNHNDSVNFYNQIISQFGYTPKMFDSTFRYYSANPKLFEPIYTSIIDELNKYQQQINELRNVDSETALNMYFGKKRWRLPTDGSMKRIFFDVPISKDSIQYKIITQLRVYPDDQSKNLRLTAYFYYVDSTGKEHKEYFPEVKYPKSVRMNVYSTSMFPPSKKFTHIRGWILNDDKQDKPFRKHIDVNSIFITRGY